MDFTVGLTFTMAFCERRDCYAVTRYIYSSRTARTIAPTHKEQRVGKKKEDWISPKTFHHFKEFEADGIISRTHHSRHDSCTGTFMRVCACIFGCERLYSAVYTRACFRVLVSERLYSVHSRACGKVRAFSRTLSRVFARVRF